ncbi:hypothetical protein E2320_018252 [Naja naja]|nr:hypothetical protein E2320_018252 [Naja naja]
MSEWRGQFLIYTFNTEPAFPPRCIFYDKSEMITSGWQIIFSPFIAVLLLEVPSQLLRGQRPSASTPVLFLGNMDSQATRMHLAREAENNLYLTIIGRTSSSGGIWPLPISVHIRGGNGWKIKNLEKPGSLALLGKGDSNGLLGQFPNTLLGIRPQLQQGEANLCPEEQLRTEGIRDGISLSPGSRPVWNKAGRNRRGGLERAQIHTFPWHPSHMNPNNQLLTEMKTVTIVFFSTAQERPPSLLIRLKERVLKGQGHLSTISSTAERFELEKVKVCTDAQFPGGRMMSPCPALHQPPAVTPLFCSKCPLTPNIQGVAALGHQFLDIVHSLLLVHLAIFSYNLVKGILHIPGHVARITGSQAKKYSCLSPPLSPPAKVCHLSSDWGMEIEFLQLSHFDGIYVTISFADQLPDMLLVLFEQMLHINLKETKFDVNGISRAAIIENTGAFLFFNKRLSKHKTYKQPILQADPPNRTSECKCPWMAYLFWLVPRESHIELSKGSFFDKFGKLFLIDVVLLLPGDPIAAQRANLSSALTLLFEPAPLLDETDEGSDPCAWPNHDDRSVRFERQPELGFPDIQGHYGFVPILIGLLVQQPVSSHPFVYSVRFGSVLHDNGTDMDGTGKQFTKVVNRRPQRRGVLQDSQDIPPGLNNPAEIQRGSHLAQLLLLTGICGILCQLIENICTWWISDIQIVGQGCAELLEQIYQVCFPVALHGINHSSEF